jgi:hypothetical protein
VWFAIISITSHILCASEIIQLFFTLPLSSYSSPSVLATMADVPASSGYKHYYVLFLRPFSKENIDDMIGIWELEDLLGVIGTGRSYNYHVSSVDTDTWGEKNMFVLNFRSWISDHVARDSLLVVCILGHGGDDEKKHKLDVLREKCYLTDLQIAACQDQAFADVLFLPLVCYAGYDWTQSVQQPANGPALPKVATIAACGEWQTTDLGDKNLFRLFGRVLGSMDEARTMEEIFAMMKRDQHGSDVELIHHGGVQSKGIVLQRSTPEMAAATKEYMYAPWTGWDEVPHESKEESEEESEETGNEESTA